MSQHDLNERFVNAISAANEEDEKLFISAPRLRGETSGAADSNRRLKKISKRSDPN